MFNDLKDALLLYRSLLRDPKGREHLRRLRATAELAREGTREPFGGYAGAFSYEKAREWEALAAIASGRGGRRVAFGDDIWPGELLDGKGTAGFSQAFTSGEPFGEAETMDKIQVGEPEPEGRVGDHKGEARGEGCEE